jgi:type II secretory pathway component PulF
MKLSYRAKERSGVTTAGEIEAESPDEARRKLRERGYFVLELSAARRGGALAGRSPWPSRGRVTKPDIVIVMSQLTIMCQSGVDLAEALKNVAEHCLRPQFKTVLESVSQDVSNGASFSEALAKHPHVFDETFVAGVAAGEKSGAMTEVFGRLTQLLRSEIRLRSAVWSMLTYPLVLCGVTFLAVNGMVFFVLPQFSKVFEDLGKAPPPLTQMLLTASQFARGNAIWILLAVGAFGFAAYRMRSTSWVQKWRDSLTLNGAVIRKATRALATGRTFRLLGTMLQSGVPLLDGIRLCRSAARNSLFRALFEQLEREVLQGQGLGKSLIAAPFLPLGAAHMIATAERSGKLGQVLETVGEYYEDEGERHLRELVKVLEPAVIIVLGVIVGIVVLSIVLPMLDVSTLAK